MMTRDRRPKHGRAPRVWLRWLTAALVVAAIILVGPAPPLLGETIENQPETDSPPSASRTIAIETVPVLLNPEDPSMTAIGDFSYAGGLVLTSRQTRQLHELSDLVMVGRDRINAVGDGGILLEARLVLDETDRLIGVSDARLMPLIDQNGIPLAGQSSSDAEGLALMPNGDRLVSFERRHRIWLYPKAGGRPRPVPSPRVRFPSNAGMEALAATPDVSADAYLVGAEESGETWTCRLTASCVKGLTIDKPAEFGLVALTELPDGLTAYLLRAYDPVRRNRIILRILKAATVIAEMHMAPPLTVDNLEGMTNVPHADGRIRFYLISDDNASASQRTLLLAFDWHRR
jgi:hypothetical protein